MTTTISDGRSTTSPISKEVDPRQIEDRQKSQFGGLKFGAAFFGWLTATGTVVILTAIVAAVAGALGMSGVVALGEPSANPQALGMIAVAVALGVVLVSYFSGGYVAGRMARFHGARQGVGVWLWALISAVVVGIVGALVGSQLEVIGRSSLPQVPLDGALLTTGGILSAVVVAGVSLVGAVLGGLAGMRFHRRVDRRTDLTTDFSSDARSGAGTLD